MKQAVAALLIFLAACPAPAATDTFDPLQVPWEEIVQEATLKGKCLYVAFLGDGWSVASTRFSREVLETESFREFAARNLVYCPILARTNPPMGKERTARLQALVIHFDMKVYPTVILMAPDGTELMRHGYREVSGEEYVRLLEAILPAGAAAPPLVETIER